MDNISKSLDLRIITMQTLSSAKVQANFGRAADIVKSGQPIAITQHGRPTLMLVSYQDGEALMRMRSTARIREYMDERNQHMPTDAPELSMDDISDLVHELRP